MIKKFKRIISLCTVIGLLALSFTGCQQPSTPEVKYKVTYESEKGTAPESIEVTENTVLNSEQLKSLEDVGEYYFAGWYDGNTKAEPGKYKVTKDVTLKALWDEKTYTVTFKTDTDSEPVKITSLKKGASVTVPAEIKRTGYEINDWYNGDKKWNFDTDRVSGDITLTGTWEIITYNITYKYSDKNKLIEDIDKYGDITTTCSLPKTYTVENNISFNEENIRNSISNVCPFYLSSLSELSSGESSITGIPKGSTGDKTIYAIVDDQSPVFKRLSIPVAGTSKAGKTIEVPLFINRKSKSGGDFSRNKRKTGFYKISCKENPEIVKDSKFSYQKTKLDAGALFDNITLTIPENAGDYTIRVECGTSTVEGILSVKDPEKYKIGDVVLNDGTIVSKENITEANINKAVAVVAGFNAAGGPFGISLTKVLKEDSTTPAWFKGVNESQARKQQIACEIGKPSEGFTPEVLDSIKGDLFGFDNEYTLMQVDTYFHINNYELYDTLHNVFEKQFETGPYSKDWYIPSCYELGSFMSNMETINQTLNALHILNNNITPLTLAVHNISSSQYNQTSDSLLCWTAQNHGYDGVPVYGDIGKDIEIHAIRDL